MSSNTTNPTPAAPTGQPPATAPAATPPTDGQPANRGGRGGRGGRGRGRGRGGNTASTGQAPAPQPAQPAGNRNATNPNPTANSKLPALTGWGPINVSVNRNTVRQRISTSALGFADLVNEEYSNLLAKHNQNARLIPRSLFQYYCHLAFWERALFLASKNDALPSTARAALRVLEQHHKGVIPDRIHQYLMCLGNFNNNGNPVDWLLNPAYSDMSGQDNNQPGFINFGANAVRTNAQSMWLYALAPVPGVSVYNVQNEVSRVVNNNGNFRNLNNIQPPPNNIGLGGTTIRPSSNICGFNIVTPDPVHSSWRATFNQLRWQRDNLPPDSETDWCISPNTLRWVSERLLSIPDYKTKPTDSLLSTTSGHFIQQYIFEPTQGDLANAEQFTVVPYTMFTPLSLRSANPVPADVVAPSFAFAIRVRHRSATIGGIQNVGISAPWQPHDATGANVPLTLPARVASSAYLSVAPQSLNLDAFSTTSERRSQLLPFLYQ